MYCRSLWCSSAKASLSGGTWTSVEYMSDILDTALMMD
jgi:hypothetical protein